MRSRSIITILLVALLVSQALAATITINPTSVTTPDQSGTMAVTGAINTGHGSTLTAASASDIESGPLDIDVQVKSARWAAFTAPQGQIVSLRLKFSWTASGSASADVSGGGSASSEASFVVQYSINGGSNWTTVVNRSVSANQVGAGSDFDEDFNASGSEDVILSPTQNISLVQVRDRMDASASANAQNVSGTEAGASAGYTTTVSNIRLEAVLASGQVIVMM